MFEFMFCWESVLCCKLGKKLVKADDRNLVRQAD
jgi:hypothetical protein